MNNRWKCPARIAIGFFGFFAAYALAQFSIAGPELGYVFDAEAAALRKLRGIPGAASFSAPLEFGVALARAEISPRQNLAIGVEAVGGAVLTLRLPTTPDPNKAPPALEGALAWPDVIAFSPKGDSAVLYYELACLAQVVTGLPDSPSITSTLDLAQLPAPSIPLAINDAGDVLLVRAPEGTVFAFTPEAGPSELLALTGDAVASFIPESRDAVIAAESQDHLYFIRDLAGSAVVSLLQVPVEALKTPKAITISDDRRIAFIVSAETHAITRINLAEPEIYSSLVCPCSPARLSQLQGSGVYLLTSYSGDPVWLFDGNGAEPRFVFVPPDRTVRTDPEEVAVGEPE